MLIAGGKSSSNKSSVFSPEVFENRRGALDDHEFRRGTALFPNGRGTLLGTEYCENDCKRKAEPGGTCLDSQTDSEAGGCEFVASLGLHSETVSKSNSNFKWEWSYG